MVRKIWICIGITFIAFTFFSCSSHPEQGLLKSYFSAVSLNDLTTMSTMAMEPKSLDFQSWEILSVSEESTEPFGIAELNKKELELKKSVEESVGITLDAKDELEDAKYELERARTGAARRAIQRKVDEAQTKYDEIYENHKNFQMQYNDAKADASKEEEITMFSLSGRPDDHPQLRDYTGTVHKKHVDVKITEKEGQVKNYRFYLRRYLVKDESMNHEYRGRWIITKIELIS